MKKTVNYIFVILLVLSFGNPGFGACQDPAFTNQPLNGNSDSIQNQRLPRIIKLNLLQALFSEIPVSFEYFQNVNKSTQFQVGFIFPYSKQPAGKLFETMGANGTASDKGLFSYRISPYNNYGLSFKTEFRKYRRYLYYGPQIMYKFCFYKEATFPVYGSGITRDQTESKFSNVFGLGYVLGWQFYTGRFVFDMYGCVGLRGRSMSVKILKIADPPRPDKYPDTKENINSFYPFINTGLRIGFKL
jgi:hypothetical protein